MVCVTVVLTITKSTIDDYDNDHGILLMIVLYCLYGYVNKNNKIIQCGNSSTTKLQTSLMITEMIWIFHQYQKKTGKQTEKFILKK